MATPLSVDVIVHAPTVFQHAAVWDWGVIGGREKVVGMDLALGDSLVARHLSGAPSG